MNRTDPYMLDLRVVATLTAFGDFEFIALMVSIWPSCQATTTTGPKELVPAKLLHPRLSQEERERVKGKTKRGEQTRVSIEEGIVAGTYRQVTVAIAANMAQFDKKHPGLSSATSAGKLVGWMRK